MPGFIVALLVALCVGWEVYYRWWRSPGQRLEASRRRVARVLEEHGRLIVAQMAAEMYGPRRAPKKRAPTLGEAMRYSAAKAADAMNDAGASARRAAKAMEDYRRQQEWALKKRDAQTVEDFIKSLGERRGE